MFKYLETFLEELGPDKAHKYCKDVIDMCLFAFKREDSNPAKSATFLPLQRILQWRLPVPDESTAADLAKSYQNAYQRVRTLTGTVKGDILETLGYLLDASPQVLSFIPLLQDMLDCCAHCICSEGNKLGLKLAK